MKYFILDDFDQDLFKKLSNIKSDYEGKFKNNELLKPFKNSLAVVHGVYRKNS